MSRLFDTARRIASAGSLTLRGGGPDMDEAGPEVEVTPFTGTTVSTPAAIVKAITAIGANRRAAANFRQQRQDKEASRVRDALEVLRLQQQTERVDYKGRDGVTYSLSPHDAAMRAQADNPLDRVEAPRKRAPFNPAAYPWGKNVSSYDPEKGDADESEIGTARMSWDAAQRATRGASATRAASTVAQANAALRALDAEAEREAESNMLAAKARADAALKVLADPNAPPPAKDAAAATIGAKRIEYSDGSVGYDHAGALDAYLRAAEARGRDRARRAQRVKRDAIQAGLEAGLVETAGGGGDWQAQLDDFQRALVEARED